MTTRMNIGRRLELAGHDAKRVVQTPRAFRNWPALLKDMAGAQLGRGAAELTFRTKAGPVLSCPNVPGARLPLYEQYADDCYRLRWLLGPLADRPLQVIDVCAHIGSFATHVASLHPRTRVECYEPSPQSARYLRRNLEQNGMSARTRVHELALAGEEGSALLDDNSGGSVHNGLVRNDRRLVDGDDAVLTRHAVPVTTTTFDRAVAACPRPPDLVKLDCEGGEYALVRASDPANWASVQRVVIEHHPVRGESWVELGAWFETAGLRLVRHVGTDAGLGTAWLARDAT